MGNNNSIITIIVMATAVVIAIFLGANVGSNDQTTPIIFLSCIVAAGLIFSMGNNLWLLVPVFWIWTGRIGLLPLPFSVAELVLLFVVGAAVASLPLGGFRFRNRLGLADWMVILMVADLAVVLAMNPVGLNALGSDTIGARPYFEVAVAFLGYLLLSNQMLTPERSTWIPKAVLFGALILSAGMTLSFVVPSVGYALFPFYSGFVPKIEALNPEHVSLVGSNRFSFLLDFSRMLLLFLIAVYPPIKIVTPLNPIRFFLFLFGSAGLMISGFRSWIVTYAIYFFIAGFFWERWRGVFKLMMIGLVGILALYITNEIRPLPLGVQRSMSFLPGNWDDAASDDARHSVEWRTQMWRDTLFTDKVVTNKLVGDGFGFSARENKILNDMRFSAGGADSATYQEYFMVTGSLHSGPLSAIRYVGYLGLLIFTIAGIVVAVAFARLIRRSWNTPYRMTALFFGIPWIFHPIYYFAIFGSFDEAAPNFIIGVGMLKMLENTLRSEETAKAAAAAKVPAVLTHQSA